MVRWGALESRLSRLRRRVTPAWEPGVNGALSLAFLVVLGLSSWASYRVWGSGWLLVFVLALCTLLRLVSTRFSVTLLRLATFAAVLVVSGGVLSVGRAERVATARRDARGAANGLSAEAAAVQQDPTFASTPVAGPQVADALAEIRALCAEGDGRPSARVQGAPAGPLDGLCLGDPRQARAWDLRPAPDRHLVAIHETKAALALAKAEAAEARDAAVAPARQVVDTREKAFAEALASSESPTVASALLDALSQGGNAIVRRVPLVDRRGVPFGLALAGWILLAAAALVGYRHLEIINGADGLGPVRVKGADADVEQFRTYLLWNVREPGAVPGAGALKPVTDLLGAAAAGVPGAAWLQRLIDAVAAALTIDHGYTVEFQTLDQGDGHTPATIAVRVMVTRTGELVDQHVTIRTKKEALRSGAYRAAAVILARSRKVASWGEWNKETSDSLAAYFLSDDNGRADIAKLREAVVKSPTSGVLCLELANAEALRGNHFRTFELALRAATLYPRYLAGRYRMALSASLLGSDPARYWYAAGEPDRQRVLAALERYEDAPTSLVDALRAEPGADGDLCAGQLCSFAHAELERLRTDTTRRRVLFRALRLRERSYWYELMRPGPGGKSLRGQLRQSVESCKLVVDSRGDRAVDPTELAMQEARVLDPRTLWLVPYNLASYHAIEHARRGSGPGGDHVARAMECLETAVERPGSFQLNRAWIDADPDLVGLHRVRRFQKFQRSLFREPTPPADADVPGNLGG